MPCDNAYTRTFNRAIEVLGAERLAGVLQASVADIEAWAAGLADPPRGKYLQAIDVVAWAWSRPRR